MNFDNMLDVPFVVKSVAYFMQIGGGMLANSAKAVRFEEIPGVTHKLKVPTSLGEVRCTVYLPPEGIENPPIHINFHGGGFVVRRPEQDDALCRYFSAKAEIVVLNVDYDVAPQAPFPTAPMQAYEVTCWAAANGATHGWDGRRLSVGGQSAGGNIATAVARMARDKGTPPISLQLLNYPPLDLVTTGAEKAARIGPGKRLLSPRMARVFDAVYVPDVQKRADPLVSPAWGENRQMLQGVAPAVVYTCEHDLLRYEGDLYAEALQQAGVLREHYVVPDADHAYNLLSDSNELTRLMYDKMVAHLRSALYSEK